MEILRIFLEEELLIKAHYAIKHLIFLKIKKYDGYQKGLASMFYNFFMKSGQVVVLKVQLHLPASSRLSYVRII